MSQALFRENALHHQHQRLTGEVMVMPKFSHKTITVLLIVWTLAIACWVGSSSFARQETVSGWLQPASGIAKVFADSQGGRISEVLVSEGQQVENGQPLIHITLARTLGDGNQMESALLEQLSWQHNLLSQEQQGNQRLYAARQQDLSSHIVVTRQSLAQLDLQISTLTQRLQLVQNRTTELAQMVKSRHISALEQEQMKQQELGLQAELQGLKRNRISEHYRLSQLQSELAMLPEQQAREANTIARRQSELTQSMTRIQGQSSYIVRATRAGRVTNLQVSHGQHVAPNRPLLSIIPDNARLSAQLLVPVRAAGFIKTGQPLQIRYDAFPHQKYGLFEGQVTAVSDAVLLPSEIHTLPLPVQEPVYLVKANLASQSVSAFNMDVGLKAGMTLSADVEVGQRTLLEWLLEPLLSLRGRL